MPDSDVIQETSVLMFCLLATAGCVRFFTCSVTQQQKPVFLNLKLHYHVRKLRSNTHCDYPVQGVTWRGVILNHEVLWWHETHETEMYNQYVIIYLNIFTILCSILAAPPTAELEPLTDGQVSQTDEVRSRVICTLRRVARSVCGWEQWLKR